VVSLKKHRREYRSVKQQYGLAGLSRGLGVALIGALIGIALWAVIVFVYPASLDLGPQPSTTALRWLEVATLLILAAWAILVAGVMALLQHRWRSSRVVTLIAGGLVLVVGGVVLIWTMSFANDCEAGHSFPLPGLHCG
jgi:hypothetical protein